MKRKTKKIKRLLRDAIERCESLAYVDIGDVWTGDNELDANAIYDALLELQKLIGE